VATLVVVRVEVAAVVVSGRVATGPRSAAALSMPGLSPAAWPPDGGGGENGWAGGTKLVTPGAAAGIGGAAVTGGTVAGTAGLGAGGVTAALGGGANIPITGACA